MTDSTTRPASSSTVAAPPSASPSARASASGSGSLRRNAAIFGAFGLLSAIFLYDAVLSGGAYVLRDIVTFFHPWQTAVRESVRAGHLPLWNPDTYCGIPLLANLQSGFFYPVNWLYWGLPFEVALTAGMVIHLTLAAFLMRGFLRRAGLGERGAFLGGALFAYGTWTLSYLEFPMKIGSIVWTPLLWTGVWEATRNGRRRGLAMAGAAVALSVFAGYPQLASFGFLSASVLALFLAVEAARRKDLPRSAKLHRIGAWPIALALGALTAAGQILPTAEMASVSTKTAAYDATVALSRSLPPKGLLGLLDPFLFGFPGADRFWGGPVGEFCFGAFYVGLLPLVFAGAAGATFRRWRRPRRVRKEDRQIVDPGPLVPRVVPWFLAVGLLLGVALALGRHTPLYPLLHEYVPGFGRSRWPATAGVLIAMHLAALAGVGFEWILRDRTRVKRTAWAAVGLGFATLAAWILAHGPAAGLFRAIQLQGVPAFQEAAYDGTRDAWLAALVLRAGTLLAAGAIGLTVGAIRSRAALAWIALIVLDLFLTGRALEMPVARDFYEKTPASVAALREELGGHRVYTPRPVDQRGNLLYGSSNLTAFEWARRHMLCNANVPVGIAQVLGCDPLAPRRHEAFTQAFDSPGTSHALRERIFDLWDAGALLDTDVRPAEILELRDANRGPILSRHEPRLGRASVLTGWEPIGDGRAVLDRLFSKSHDPRTRVLLEAAPGGPAPPAARAPSRRAMVVPCEYEPNRMRIAWHVGDGGVLRVLESWAPGWTAMVNGKSAPVLRADFLFLAVPVPPGSCDVVLEYRPASVRRGLILSLLGVLLLIVAGVSDGRRRSAVAPDS